MKIKIWVSAFAVLAIAAGCNKNEGGGDNPEYITVGFENVKSENIAVSEYGENFYSEYGANQCKGFTDETSEMSFMVNTVDGATEFWNGGWGISNYNDTKTASYLNQFSVYYNDALTDKGGHGGSSNFIVCNEASAAWSLHETFVFFPEGKSAAVDHLWVCNSTYTVLSMKEGDDFAKQFSYEDKDFLLLKVTGVDADGNQTGSQSIYLADFRSETSPGITEGWHKLTLSSLGEVNKLVFSLSSSDNTDGKMNTPSYFCVDDITIVK